MAGCLPAPKSSKTSSARNNHSDCIDQKSNFRQKTRKFPNQLHQPQHQTITSSTDLVHDTEVNRKFGILMDDDLVDAGNHNQSTSGGAIGLIIKHFLNINEKLNQLKMEQSSLKMDILRICHMDVIEQDEKFMEFIQGMNEDFAEHQCVALSKLLTFSQNPQLMEDRQMELYKACLEKWQIPTIERSSIPWPLLSINRSAIIHGLLGDNEHCTSPNMLPSEYRPNIRLTQFTHAHLHHLDTLRDSRIVLICGNPSIAYNSEPAQSMFIYSRGFGTINTYCTTDGDQWNNLDQVIPRLKPRLPPGTLIWGQPFYEYSVK
ncbi:unnamed protein product, partial [Schistosoma turkestanicum]